MDGIHPSTSVAGAHPGRLRGPGDILAAAANKHPSKAALITATRTLTYGELDDLSARAASGLLEQGVKPDDVVSLYSQNSWQWIVAYHAVLRAGAVVNPINIMLTPPEVAYVLADCRSVCVLTTIDRVETFQTIASSLPNTPIVLGLDARGPHSLAALFNAEPRDSTEHVDPMALSTIAYTSGTTGHPKGAMQSHQAVLLNCALTATMHGRSVNDVVVTALPAPHVYGNVVINSTFIAGGTVVLMERFATEQAINLIREHRATMFEGVPAMYAMMLSSCSVAGAEFDSLRVCTVGGQTISNATIEAWETLSGAPLLELWGMSEIAGLGTTHAVHVGPVRGSIGVSLPGTTVRIADLDNASKTVPVGVSGELMVHGPIVMMGYYGNEEETARTITSDGWLHTGDIGYQDASGYVFVIDRRKDMIITGGYNVYPAEIERVLAAHPAVEMVAVGPIQDEVKGELACAYVVCRPGVDACEIDLIDFTRDKLAAYKRPRKIVFVSSLPTTSTGKIMRRRLADHAVDVAIRVD